MLEFDPFFIKIVDNDHDPLYALNQVNEIYLLHSYHSHSLFLKNHRNNTQSNHTLLTMIFTVTVIL